MCVCVCMCVCALHGCSTGLKSGALALALTKECDSGALALTKEASGNSRVYCYCI